MATRIQREVPLAPYTTFKIGGPAEYFVSVSTEKELEEAVAWAKERALSVTIIAGGSNVLIADEGVRGLVIKNDIGGITYEEKNGQVSVTAGAGVVWDDLVTEAATRGLWGFENLSAIPGSVGATPIQNVGAYGVEVADLIARVRVYDKERKLFTELSPEECGFAYRDSIFKHAEGKQYVVTAVTYVLSKDAQPKLQYKDLDKKFGEREAAPTLSEIRGAVIAIRRGKFPDWQTVGTAGSFFKNLILSKDEFNRIAARYPELPGFRTEDDNVKVPLGWILDHVLALKGVTEGAVGTYEHQALVVVNHGGATARDVQTFAQEIAQKVFDATGVYIEWEVTYVS